MSSREIKLCRKRPKRPLQSVLVYPLGAWGGVRISGSRVVGLEAPHAILHINPEMANIFGKSATPNKQKPMKRGDQCRLNLSRLKRPPIGEEVRSAKSGPSKPVLRMSFPDESMRNVGKPDSMKPFSPTSSEHSPKLLLPLERTFSDEGKVLFFEDQLKSLKLSTGDIT
ncbi:hypothetical protein TNCV_3405821 [Trichonephila clavipes]|nr:hypothetical protein TNCV_3405821 [Trichonephila clavipes]